MDDILATATEKIAMEMGKQRVQKKQIAERIGVSAYAVGSVVNDIAGERNPSFKLVMTIWTKGLGKQPSELFGG